MRIQCGVSLIEVMVALFIAALTLGVGVPWYQHAIPQQQANIAQTQLRQTIHYARTMAVQLGQPVDVCPYSEAALCGNDWSQGYQVVVSDTVLRQVRDDNTIHHRLTLRAFPQSRYLRFLPEGYQQNQNGRFYYQAQHAAWQLVISRTGRVRINNSLG